jgi:hypothetical protein
MGQRQLTDAEIRAYQEMAAAARRLREAQRAAEEARPRKNKGPAALSLTEAATRKGGGRGK